MGVNLFLKKKKFLSKLDHYGAGILIISLIFTFIFSAYYFDSLNKEKIRFDTLILDPNISLDTIIQSGKSYPSLIIFIGAFFLVGTIILFFSIRQSRKRAEYIAQTKTKSLEEVLLFQKLIMDNIPDFIFVKDSNFRIIAANNSFLNAYPENIRQSIIGTTTVENYNEKDAKNFLKNDQEAFDKGISEVEEIITFPNGEEKTLLTKKVRFENHRNEKFILGIARDITERNMAEKEIIRSNDELERFAYIASHDLQEPLRMIINFTSLLHEDYNDHIDKDGQYYMKVITESAHRMKNLIVDLLEYSKVGQNETNNDYFSSKEKIEFAVDNLHELIKESKAVLTFEGDFPLLYGNEIRFMRLIQNLIGNAIKYRDINRTPEIIIKNVEEKNNWKFSIEDNGIGIKDEYLQNIFIIFKRLHNKDEYSGTGIGLAVCKKIVEGFGGEIMVESKFNQGSKFIFTFPKSKKKE